MSKHVYYGGGSCKPGPTPGWKVERSWGKVMFLHVSVILFTAGGVSVQEGSLSSGWSLSGGSLSRRPPPPYGNAQAVRILLECIPV